MASQWVHEQGTRAILTAGMALLTALLWPSVAGVTNGWMDDKCFYGCAELTEFGFVLLVVTTC